MTKAGKDLGFDAAVWAGAQGDAEIDNHLQTLEACRYNTTYDRDVTGSADLRLLGLLVRTLKSDEP